MSRKKGLSFEEKCTKMVELLHESLEPFNLKQLETVAQKKKGIVSKTVKDVLQMLIADGLIMTDKVGSGVYYWSFPSQVLIQMENKIAAEEQALEGERKRKRELDDELAEVKRVRVEGDERTEMLGRVEELTAKEEALDAEIAKYSAIDPDALKDMYLDMKDAYLAANRWTDNIFALKSYAKNKFNMDGGVFDQAFQIPETFDYVDEPKVNINLDGV